MRFKNVAVLLRNNSHTILFHSAHTLLIRVYSELYSREHSGQNIFLTLVRSPIRLAAAPSAAEQPLTYFLSRWGKCPVFAQCGALPTRELTAEVSCVSGVLHAVTRSRVHLCGRGHSRSALWLNVLRWVDTVEFIPPPRRLRFPPPVCCTVCL